MKKIIQGENVCLPEYKGGSIVNIPCSLLELFGVKPAFPPLKKEIFSIEKYKGISKVVLFLFDSLGYNRLIESGCLKEFDVKSVTSVFPSTTVAAFTSFYTGVTPSVHGMVGYRLLLKEFGLTANMIKLSPVGFKQRDKLLQIGFNPRKFLPVKTIFEILGKKEIKSFAFTRMEYYKSGLSTLMLKGAEVIPYINIVDLFINVKKILDKERKNVFVTAYIDDFDTAAHYYGTRTEEEKASTEIYLKIMKDIFLDGSMKNTLILLGSDHGQMQSPSTSKVDIGKYRWFLKGLTMPPTGEFRASYLYLRNGMEQGFLEKLNEEFSNRFIILKSDKAITLELFGDKKVSSRLKERIGDVIMVSKGTNFLSYPYDEFELRARHGGLNENEMRVPFVVLKP